MNMHVKTPDDWAREFKLHHCIGKKSFAKQILRIQLNVVESIGTAETTFKKIKSALDKLS